MNAVQEQEAPANILVVDDTPENLRILMQTLEGEGYVVRPVVSGRLAVSGAKRLPPDIILLDINMPEMNGYDVCAELKADEALRDIPIIFVSALDEAFDKVKAFDAGGVDYISKPFQVEEVLARISTHLQIRRLRCKHEQTIDELKEALENVTQLRGLIPMCSHCKQIRNDQGYWDDVENYIAKSSDAHLTHSICPNCVKEHYPEFKDAPFDELDR